MDFFHSPCYTAWEDKEESKTLWRVINKNILLLMDGTALDHKWWFMLLKVRVDHSRCYDIVNIFKYNWLCPASNWLFEECNFHARIVPASDGSSLICRGPENKHFWAEKIAKLKRHISCSSAKPIVFTIRSSSRIPIMKGTYLYDCFVRHYQIIK